MKQDIPIAWQYQNGPLGYVVLTFEDQTKEHHPMNHMIDLAVKALESEVKTTKDLTWCPLSPRSPMDAVKRVQALKGITPYNLMAQYHEFFLQHLREHFGQNPHGHGLVLDYKVTLIPKENLPKGVQEVVL